MATEQGVWRAAHAVAAHVGLNALQIAELRAWTAQRMRELPFAVWEGADPSAGVRPSFIIAIECAAGRLAQGKSPERQEEDDDVSTR